jgi:hypothetical protein
VRTAEEIARIKRTLKKLPHIPKRGKVSLLDLFPDLDVGEFVFEKRERPPETHSGQKADGERTQDESWKLA